MVTTRTRLCVPVGTWSSQEARRRSPSSSHAVYVLNVSYGVCWSVGARENQPQFCRSRSEDWRTILPRCAADERSAVRGYFEYFTHCLAGRGSGTSSSDVTAVFIPPSLWPSNRRDLNSVGSAVLGILQDRVYRSQIKDVTWKIGSSAWGGVRRSWSACDWRCSQRMETALQRTEDILNIHYKHNCFASHTTLL